MTNMESGFVSPYSGKKISTQVYGEKLQVKEREQYLKEQEKEPTFENKRFL